MEKTISRELRCLNNIIMRFFDRECNISKMSKLSCMNLWIIGYIAENKDKDIYQKDIEDVFSITRSTASRVVDLMEEKGLVKRIKVAHDARLRKLVLTDKAWGIAEDIKNHDDQLNMELCENIDEADLEVFFKCIDVMKSNIEK